jgi:nucleoid-associated protein YgaU
VEKKMTAYRSDFEQAAATAAMEVAAAAAAAAAAEAAAVADAAKQEAADVAASVAASSAAAARAVNASNAGELDSLRHRHTQLCKDLAEVGFLFCFGFFVVFFVVFLRLHAVLTVCNTGTLSCAKTWLRLVSCFFLVFLLLFFGFVLRLYAVLEHTQTHIKTWQR